MHVDSVVLHPGLLGLVGGVIGKVERKIIEVVQNKGYSAAVSVQLEWVARVLEFLYSEQFPMLTTS